MIYMTSWLKRKIASRMRAGTLDSQSSQFYDLISRTAKIKQVATGFQFTEGPVWLVEEKVLLFSDIPASKILKLTPDNRVTVFRQPSSNSNGLTCDKQGRLVACEHGSRRVTRTELDGSITVLADKYCDSRLNSPNDVVVKSDGAVYFTDPPYGIQPEQQEQPVRGVYRLSPDQNELTLVADDFTAPNGLAFSPDEGRLYIDDSERRHVRVFDVQLDGSLSTSHIFHDMNVDKPGCPDGMKVDSEGNVYCTGPGGIWVLNREGARLGIIVMPEQPTNCAWGDEDLQSLYITAQTSVYRIRTNIPGMHLQGVCRNLK
jgi:gluconolactonase